MKISSKLRKKYFKVLSGYSSDGKAAVFTLGFAYIFLLAEIIYKFKKENEICTWEILLLFLMFAVFGFFKKLFTNPLFPKRFDGTMLPTGNTSEDKKIRNRYYKTSALLYGIVFSSVIFLASLLSANNLKVNIAAEFFTEAELPNIIFAFISAVVVFVISYSLSYMVDFLWYENIISYANETSEEDFETDKNQDISENPEETKLQTELQEIDSFNPKDKNIKDNDNLNFAEYADINANEKELDETGSTEKTVKKSKPKKKK